MIDNLTFLFFSEVPLDEVIVGIPILVSAILFFGIFLFSHPTPLRRRTTIHYEEESSEDDEEEEDEKVFITVEGNIGCGKSTFMHKLGKLLDYKKCHMLYEPLDVWLNYNGTNALEEFYKDTQTNFFKFQSIVFQSMFELHHQPVLRQYRIMERSLYSIVHVFVRNFVALSHMDYHFFIKMYNIYNKFIELFTKSTKHVHFVVYLCSLPHQDLKRINARGRSEENGITIEYLTALNTLHQQLYNDERFLEDHPDKHLIVLLIDDEFDAAASSNDESKAATSSAYEGDFKIFKNTTEASYYVHDYITNFMQNH